MLILLAVSYWLIDGMVDIFVFGNRLSQSLFQPPLHELWMRSITLSILIVFVLVAKALIDKRKKAEKTAHHLNRVLRAIRNVNQLITKENDETRLIEKSCKLLTETRGYKGALIILIDEQGNFVKLEESGWKNHRKKLEEQLKRGEFIECFRIALNQPGVILIEETKKECLGCPLISENINNRSMTCRLEYDGNIYGLISVNLPKNFATLKEEQELVEEVAGDLAFAIHKIRMEEKLRETEKRYRLLAETATDIICIHDMEGNIRYINPAGLNILGKTPEEAKKENIHNYIYSTDELNDRKEERLKGDSVTYTYQTHIKNFEGETIPLEINSTPLEHDGKIEGILIIARDITERKQSEKALEDAKNKAIESDRLKSAFLMNLSHEIRTPLNGILGFSQILQEREFSFEKQKEFLDIVYNKANQLLNILNDLLDLSKIEAEQLNIRQEDCYLNDIMHEIYDSYTLELNKNQKTGITLKYHCGLKRADSRLYSDCNRFRQILKNLLSNAIKFTEEGTIDFGYEFKEPDTLVFHVKDTGTGISVNKQEQIFEPFRQGDESTSREYEGTGLGLAISKSLVELLGGRMWVKSEEGKGSCFYFTIPYSKHKFEQETVKPEVSGYSYLWSGHKVLIVEDDLVSLEFMQEIFSETKVQILSAQNGEEALRIFRKKPEINLILMDIRLPDMSGLEVVKKIRSNNMQVPIIAQTAYTMDNDAKKCLESGCTDYLTKPIDIKAMMSVMNKYLNQRMV